MTSRSAISRLGPGREFDIIRSFLSKQQRTGSSEILVGPGDDAAVLLGGKIVLSVDLSVEGVHFRRDWMTPEEIGYRAAAAGLSDLAAMAAEPVGVLASLAIAEADVDTFAVRLMDGIREAAEPVGAALIGGDLTRSSGPLVVDVISAGRVEKPILRSGAGAGDELWVTGTLGAAALAVRSLEAGEHPDPMALERLVRPTPRVREALWLAALGIPTAMLDLSDGLGKDAAHLAAASGSRVVIEEERLPVHPSVLSALPRSEAVRLALSGGEDYELCFAAVAGSVDGQLNAFQGRFGATLHRVGRIEEGDGVVVKTIGGEVHPYYPDGFLHFGADT